MAYGYIYLVRNAVNGKVYVGQTTDSCSRRWTQHCSKAVTKGTPYPLHNAVRKYGRESFSISQIAQCESQAELNALEVQLISQYKANDRRYGYNVRSGGDGGGKHSLEARQRMGISHRGKPSWNKGRQMDQAWRDRVRSQMQVRAEQMRGKELSAEHRAKISAGRTGSQKVIESQRLRWSRPEERERVSRQQRGHHVSAETREKISARHKGRTLPDWQIDFLRRVNTGRKLSLETRQKMSAAQQRRRLREGVTY